ncbi:MAG: hypothetical protein ACK5Y2_11020 [Bdellovibrionales bacterium]
MKCLKLMHVLVIAGIMGGIATAHADLSSSSEVDSLDLSSPNAGDERVEEIPNPSTQEPGINFDEWESEFNESVRGVSQKPKCKQPDCQA